MITDAEIELLERYIATEPTQGNITSTRWNLHERFSQLIARLKSAEDIGREVEQWAGEKVSIVPTKALQHYASKFRAHFAAAEGK